MPDRTSVLFLVGQQKLFFSNSLQTAARNQPAFVSSYNAAEAWQIEDQQAPRRTDGSSAEVYRQPVHLDQRAP